MRRCRWIEQERVVPHHAARRPIHLDQQIEEGLGDRGGRRDAQVRGVAGTTLERNPRTREHALVLQVVLAVQRRIRDLGRERVEFFLRRGEQFDPRRQRLSEIRIDGQLAEPQRERGGRQRKRGQDEAMLEDWFDAHADPFGNAYWLKVT